MNESNSADRSDTDATATRRGADDAKVAKAKLFMHGRSQAVRLPKEFRFPGKEVRVRRVENGVLLEPMAFDVKAWSERLDKYRHIPFMPEGREQPEMPPDESGDSFDE
jgi:antitoxin VapB